MRGKLRFFGNDDGINMANMQFALGQHLANPLKKNKARYPFPLRVCIRKEGPNIARARGAKQRVADGVREHVTIRMADGPFIERHFDATEDELSPPSQAVQVVANARRHHCLRLFMVL